MRSATVWTIVLGIGAAAAVGAATWFARAPANSITTEPISITVTAPPPPPQVVQASADARTSGDADGPNSNVKGQAGQSPTITAAEHWFRSDAWMWDFMKQGEAGNVIASIETPRPRPPFRARPSGTPSLAQAQTSQPTDPPTPSPPTTAQSDEAACRARERSLGIVDNPGPCVDLAAIVANLPSGKYRFNRPKSAYVGEAFRLTLVLQTTPGQNVDDRFGGTSGEVVVRERPFAQALEATLRADDLKVEPAAAQARTATTAAPVEWTWMLTPQSQGEKRLIIEVVATIKVGADKHPVQVTTLHEAIVIQVGLLQQVKLYVAEFSGLIATLTGLLTALGGLFAFVPSARRFVFGLFRRDDPQQPTG
ncbi:hypothetical protein DNX69_20375 [Rhodopseudomonas palustris]|uniref:Uncharacterized protein n=1 Tax=Rhodopseudomonas palustris TaxID=1076 RepID=A0A323UD74_RHOPL|nr:hypothetical protein [Rhodopseudomonas palustris]PZA10173.1 hypothetical protein DNX69_20375 [Rhodopseudomonas palustris]